MIGTIAMDKYQYSPLKADHKEIRLISLLPGDHTAPIRISIHHSILHPSADAPVQEQDTALLEVGLPYPWGVIETYEGDVLYVNVVNKSSSWARPPGAASIALPPSYKPDVTPRYEALSYTWGTMDNPTTALVEPPGQVGRVVAMTLSIGQNLGTAFRYLRYADRTRTLWVDAICINQNDIYERNTQVKLMADIPECQSSCCVDRQGKRRQQTCNEHYPICWRSVHSRHGWSSLPRPRNSRT
jgi:hypothetical protein